MGFQKLFCSKENLEAILYNEDEYKTLYNIASEFCDVIIDVDNDTLQKEIDENIYYKKLWKREWAELKGEPDVHEAIKREEFYSFLNDILILDEDESITQAIRENYGILAINIDESFIEDQNPMYKFSVKQGQKSLKCWSEICKEKPIIPINSAIIIDNYIWKNPNNYKAENEDNLYPLLEAIIPSNLVIPFHLIIIIQNGAAPHLTKEKAKEIANKMKKRLQRPHGVEISILTQTDTEAFHKRVILTNYHYIESEKGFITFTNKRATKKTSGARHWVFKDINNFINETEKHHHYYDLIAVKELVSENSSTQSDYVFNQGNTNSPLLSNLS